MEFKNKWLTRVENVGNNVIIGNEFAMPGMRDKMTLPEGTTIEQFREITLKHVESTAKKGAASTKFNAGYFQTPEKMSILKEAAALAKSLGLIVFIDAKISDIGSTNDAWLFDHMNFGFDVTTIAPYAANIKDTVQMTKNRNLAGIGMGFMSNPEYVVEALFVKESDVVAKMREASLILKEALKKLNSESEIKFLKSEFANLMIDLVVDSDESQFILDRLYEYRIKELAESGAEGIVVGATLKPENPHLKRTLELAKDNNLFILGPGVGAQGGTIDGFADMLEANGIDFKMVGPNIGRDTMFPKGSNSNDDDRSGAIEFFVKAAARRILKSR